MNGPIGRPSPIHTPVPLRMLSWVVAPNSMPFSTGAATLGMGSFTGTPNIVPGFVTALVLAVNPSVTGTVYQNVCGYGVWICFPVTTAGTVTVHTGPYSAATNELWDNATAVGLNGQIMFYVAQNCYWKITLGGAAALSAGDCQCPTYKKWKPDLKMARFRAREVHPERTNEYLVRSEDSRPG